MKSSLHELAVFGGPPAFHEKLHVGRPNIGDRARLLERINDILDRKWLTNDGPYVAELEKRIAEFIGVKHCIAMCNGTIALEIAIRGAGLEGEVIVPSFTFAATAHALQWQAITPVFCDIDPRTHNLDPRRVEEMITPRTTGILGVHLWGRACAVEELDKIARGRGLTVLYDAAHAFGCTHNGHMIGNFGSAEVFSFHATKFFNTFEGGAVVTNDDELAGRIRLMKNFGFAGYDRVTYIGTNGKMTEVSAAMGLTSLEAIQQFVETNRRNYECYRKEFGGLEGVSMVRYDERERNNYQYIILEIDDAQTHITRDQLVKILHAENVLARRYFYPGCHEMEPYRSYFPHAGLLLPVTETITERVMSLPNGTSVGEAEIAEICAIIRMVIQNGEELAAELDGQT